ncbi:unnamed protein product, partial [Musa hybrid cultivar]
LACSFNPYVFFCNKDEESKFKFKEKAPLVQRKPLKHRNYEVDLESHLGKTQVVTPIASLSQQVSNEVNIQSMNLYFAGWILLFSLSESSRHVYEGGEGNSSTGILCSCFLLFTGSRTI